MSKGVATVERGELKKAVEYVHVAGDLSLMERKIINILLLYAYDDLTAREEHSIPVPLLLRAIGWESTNNWDTLKKALRKIKRVELEFDAFTDKQKRDGDWLLTNPIGEVRLLKGEGICRYSYGPELRSKLKDPKVYALINMKLQRDFQTSYGLALYENTVRYKDVGSTGWQTVDSWRNVLAARKYDSEGNVLPSAYDTFKVFNASVLKKAVQDVNTWADEFEIEPEFEKVGREVKRIRFLIKPKTQSDMFGAKAVDMDALKNSAGWAALESLGCRPTFITQALGLNGEEWALDVAEECRAPSVKNPAGLAKHFLEKGIIPAKRKPKTAKAVETVAQDTDTRGPADSERGAWEQLTKEEREALAEEFVLQTEAVSRISGKYEFRDVHEKLAWAQFRGKRAMQVLAAR